jgi:hypothetical protein
MKNFVFLVLLLSFFITSCGKEGPVGKDGVGAPGINGVDGNANVRSATKAIFNGNWQNSSDLSAEASLDFPIVTEDIANTGLVMVYLQYQNSTNWIAMPFSISGQGYTENFGFSFTAGKVVLQDYTDVAPLIKPDGMIRVVAVSSEGRMAPVNWNEYEDVKNYFELKE